MHYRFKDYFNSWIVSFVFGHWYIFLILKLTGSPIQWPQNGKLFDSGIQTSLPVWF